MTAYTAEIEASTISIDSGSNSFGDLGSSVITIDSGVTNLAWQHQIAPEAGVITISGGDLTIAAQQRLTALTSTITIASATAELRVSSGRLVAASSTISIGGGFADLRSNGLVVFPAPGAVTSPGTTSPIYPTWKPTTREFVPPFYAMAKVNAMSNRASRYLIASKPSQAALSLGYENVYDSLANELIDIYNQCYGAVKPVVIPADFLSGLGVELKDYVQLYGSSLAWRWDGPPTIEAVQTGIVNINVKFRATITVGAIGTAVGANSSPYTPTDYIDTQRYPSFT